MERVGKCVVIGWWESGLWEETLIWFLGDRRDRVPTTLVGVIIN